MNIILFGATGYIGSHVAEQLIDHNYDVTCLVRPSSDTRFLNSIGTQVSNVDFNNDDALSALMEEDSIVINCIADTRPHASYQQRASTEIELTSHLFALAQRNHVKRFIQLSTVMAYGFDRPVTAIDETHPLKPTYIYNQIAADREAHLLKQYKSDSSELILLRPSNALGKRDSSFLPSFIGPHKFSLFPVVNGGQWKFSCIDCRDIGRAMVHLLELEIDKPETYLVKGFDLSWLELKSELDRFLGKPSRTLSLPKNLMMKMAYLMEKIYPYGSSPPVTRFDMEVLSTDTLFDDSKLRNTGFQCKYSLLDSFQDALD